MTTILEIQNLKCGGCANTISTKLAKLDAITDININNANNTVSFNYTSKEDLLAVKDTLAKLGYPVIGDKNALTSKAKSFVSCAIGRLNN